MSEGMNGGRCEVLNVSLSGVVMLQLVIVIRSDQSVTTASSQLDAVSVENEVT